MPQGEQTQSENTAQARSIVLFAGFIIVVLILGYKLSELTPFFGEISVLIFTPILIAYAMTVEHQFCASIQLQKMYALCLGETKTSHATIHNFVEWQLMKPLAVSTDMNKQKTVNSVAA